MSRPSVTQGSFLLERLKQHAARRPEVVALAFSPRAASDELTWQALLAQVERAAAAYLAHGVAPGDVVLVVTPSTRTQMIAFLGAIACGALPSIVSYPSSKQSLASFRSSLEAAIVRTQARWLVVAESFREALTEIGGGLRQLTDDTILRGEAPAEALGRLTPRSPDDPLFLQFSSGTTGLRKSVAITGRMLESQAEAYARRLSLDERDRVASWLPLYHDMGLVGAFLIPLVRGVAGVHLSPFDWLLDPITLFDAIALRGATFAWLPNFAYRFLVDRLGPTIDTWTGSLSGLRAFINCSEPVRNESHRAFFAAFERVGCRMDQLHACYAAAENTFAITQTALGQAARVDIVEGVAFRREQRAAPAASAEGALAFVSCGKPVDDTSVRIAGATAERKIGEIEMHGGSLIGSYYAAVDIQRNEAFTEDGWYRSGDLGYLADGELFVTGRLKELIIHRGTNVYAGDLEDALSRLPQVRPGRVVVFGVSDDERGTEDIVVLLEVTDGTSAAEIVERARTLVLGAFGVALADVVLAEPGSLIKTTSGKLSRASNRARYLSGWYATTAPEAAAAVPASSSDERVAGPSELLRHLREAWTKVLRKPVGDDTHLFAEAGADSVSSATAIARIREICAQAGIEARLVPEQLLAAPTIRAQAALLTSPIVTEASRGLQRLSTARTRRGVVMLHDGHGQVLNYLPMARALSPAYEFLAIPHPGLTDEHRALPRHRALVDEYLSLLADSQLDAVVLGGFCYGAQLAIDMAERLLEEGKPVAGLLLLDPLAGYDDRKLRWLTSKALREGAKLLVRYLPDYSLRTRLARATRGMSPVERFAMGAWSEPTPAHLRWLAKFVFGAEAPLAQRDRVSLDELVDELRRLHGDELRLHFFDGPARRIYRAARVLQYNAVESDLHFRTRPLDLEALVIGQPRKRLGDWRRWLPRVRVREHTFSSVGQRHPHNSMLLEPNLGLYLDEIRGFLDRTLT